MKRLLAVAPTLALLVLTLAMPAAAKTTLHEPAPPIPSAHLSFLSDLGKPQTVAMDKVGPWLFSQNPPSQWLNMYEQDVDLGFGQLIYDVFGGSVNWFSNLCTLTDTGLYVQAGPCTANTGASLYQYQVEEASTFGGPGATALPANPSKVGKQGLLWANGPAIGPLTPPSTSGWSQKYMIECQVPTPQQLTSQAINFVSSSGLTTPGSAFRDWVRPIACQSKAGTAGLTPTAPTVDSGWLANAIVTVAQGQSTIISGNIAQVATNQFQGFAILGTSPTFANMTLSALAANGCLGLNGSSQIVANSNCMNPSSAFTMSNTFTVAAQGTATNVTNYPSYCVNLNQSVWVSGAPQTNTWCAQHDNSSVFHDLDFLFDGSIEVTFSNTGFIGANALHAIAPSVTDGVSSACGNGYLCSASANSNGVLVLGTNAANCATDFGATTSGAETVDCPLQEENYTHTGGVTGVAHMVTDSVTATVSPACNSLTVCTLSAGSSVTLSGRAVYTGATTFTCSPSNGTNGVIATCAGGSGTTVNFQIFNPTAGTLANNTNVVINYTLTGY